MALSKLTLRDTNANSITLAGKAKTLSGASETSSFPEEDRLTLVLQTELEYELTSDGNVQIDAGNQVIGEPKQSHFNISWSNDLAKRGCAGTVKLTFTRYPADPFVLKLLKGPLALPVPGTYCDLRDVAIGQQFIFKKKLFELGGKTKPRRPPLMQCWPVLPIIQRNDPEWILSTNIVKALADSDS